MLTYATIKDTKITNVFYYETEQDAETAYNNGNLGDIDLYAEMPDGFWIGDNYIDGEWIKAETKVEVDTPTITTDTMLAKITAQSLGVTIDYTPEETAYIAKTAGLTPVADGKDWQAGTWLADGTKVNYNGKNYEVIQGHISQDNWAPDKVPALFVELKEDYAEWEQPLGHNPYMLGDKVMFNGKKYESIIDNNTWSPSAYPQGWKEISE